MQLVRKRKRKRRINGAAIFDQNDENDEDSNEGVL